MSKLFIGDRPIGEGYSPFIIAEMSGNHNQSLDRALRIVKAAATAGAHAIKLQTYTPDTMTLDLAEREFYINDPSSLWRNKSLYDLYEIAQTPWEWHRPIFDYARELGLIAFSTPFDFSAVEFLETLDVPCYKISSFENTDVELIKRVARTGKPVIMSTGMATLAELDESVRAAREAGCNDLVLLKCSSAYPAAAEQSNLLSLPHMRSMFECEVGLSDHTTGFGVPIAAVALGATVIEKHFTLSQKDGGIDSPFSTEPGELALLVSEVNSAWSSLGKVAYGPTDSEKNSITHRRSLYIVRDMAAGEVLSKANLRAIRPGLGLPTKYEAIVQGKSVNRDIPRGTALTWDLLL